MTPADQLELATKARADVARAIALLERATVGALDQSAADLTVAAQRMQRLKDDSPSGGAMLKSILVELRKDLRRAGTLLRHAWEFRVGLGGQVGYNWEGELTPQPVSTRRWTLEG
jgi:hypothetical protein